MDTVHACRLESVHNTGQTRTSYFIGNSEADLLCLMADLLICRWVALALKCPLVKAIQSVMSRKDDRLKDP